MISPKKLEEYKRKYAHLIAVCGLNNVKNRVCQINADIDQPDFVLMLMEELYDRGAKRVDVHWTYRPLLKTIYQYTDADELMKVYPYEVSRIKYDAKQNTAKVTLESWDPAWMDGVDADKVMKRRLAVAKIARPYRVKMDMVETPWCLAALPGHDWAKRLFPNDTDEVAMNKMWEKTLECCRCLKGDPVENWRKFNKEIKARAKWLDSLHIKTLHYTNKLGTDLIVGVNPHAHFCGGAHADETKSPFNSNMPAVETYTSPNRLVTEGVVYASKPLCRNGHMMDGIKIRFHKGRIVEVSAKKGEAFLKKMISTDEGAHYLGELALVPYDSPVSNTKMIYYQTIFDENAACHFAFGYSLLSTYEKRARHWSDEQRIKHGINRASTHTDFMIGTDDLNIVATTRDNRKIQIFKNGNWAKKI
ncbi:MAG: aminopeptidase [Bacilli bacterium]|nr:aminopeptidase [Bacilli bacterium]